MELKHQNLSHYERIYAEKRIKETLDKMNAILNRASDEIGAFMPSGKYYLVDQAFADFLSPLWEKIKDELEDKVLGEYVQNMEAVLHPAPKTTKAK